MAGDGRRLSAWAQAELYFGATFEFLGAVGLCTLGGWWLDEKVHTKPWLLVAGAVFGFAAGMYVMFRRFLGLAADDKARQESGGKEGKS